MRNTCLVFLLSAVLLHPGSANAQDGWRFELTPFIGYRMGGELDAEDNEFDIELDDSVSAGLLLNWQHRENTEWEIHYSRQDSVARIRNRTSNEINRVDFDAHSLQLGGIYSFDGNRLVPYLAMTLGGSYVRTSGDQTESDTFFSGSLGLGVRYAMSERVGLRLEARAYGTLVRSSTDIFCESNETTGACDVRVEGDIIGQVETFAGVTVRF